MQGDRDHCERIQAIGVSFRQEVFRSKLQWQETVGGDTTEMPNIKVITANLKPNETEIGRAHV